MTRLEAARDAARWLAIKDRLNQYLPDGPLLEYVMALVELDTAISVQSGQAGLAMTPANLVDRYVLGSAETGIPMENVTDMSNMPGCDEYGVPKLSLMRDPDLTSSRLSDAEHAEDYIETRLRAGEPINAGHIRRTWNISSADISKLHKAIMERL